MDLLNDRVVQFFDGFGIPLQLARIDYGTEFCRNPAHHENLRSASRSPPNTTSFEAILSKFWGDAH
ncbi:hypothetical protein [Paraburkholderia kururiensis]|uniref:hypothetical protein n=1 Tax=Paraburkholderia kururiensis TaxID=984307 RepID=UPI0018F5AE82|nr:hypothetical protein [Paraburkholderia kururiensis]